MVIVVIHGFSISHGKIKREELLEDIFFVVIDALVIIILESVLIFGLISARDLHRNNDAAKMIKTIAKCIASIEITDNCDLMNAINN
jgi:hypothetical protein